jgi:peroxiredoxin (alkyl hydroperoxide reductase subunit C)
MTAVNLPPTDFLRPVDDGAADHLVGMAVPDATLLATDGRHVSLAQQSGRTVVYAYPRTGTPGVAPLTHDWDRIAGARGCTPQSCNFRDHASKLQQLGVNHLFGLSTQSTEEQREAASRLALPFRLLSDEKLKLAKALRLPTFEAGGVTLHRRLTLVIDSGWIKRVCYPVFPSDQNATEVANWLRAVR